MCDLWEGLGWAGEGVDGSCGGLCEYEYDYEHRRRIVDFDHKRDQRRHKHDHCTKYEHSTNPKHEPDNEHFHGIDNDYACDWTDDHQGYNKGGSYEVVQRGDGQSESELEHGCRITRCGRAVEATDRIYPGALEPTYDGLIRRSRPSSAKTNETRIIPLLLRSALPQSRNRPCPPRSGNSTAHHSREIDGLFNWD